MKNALTLLTLPLFLAACSKTPPPAPQRAAPAAKPAVEVAAAVAPPAPGSAPAQPPELPRDQEDALMRALFGDAYDAGNRRAFGPLQEEGSTRRMRMSFETANTLPDGRTAVIVSSVEADDREDEYPSIAAEGTLDVYVLRRHDTGWEVLERHEAVAAMGSMGNLGTVTWLPLADGKPAFMIASHSFNRGYSIDGADIFLVEDDGDDVRSLGGFLLASSNVGACMPGTDDCWEVESAVRIADGAPAGAYRDLLVDFKGRHYTVTEDADGKDVEHLTRTVRQTARYRFDGKEYVLVAGTNPVPRI